MPAVTVDDLLVPPRVPRPEANASVSRPVTRVVSAQSTVEGAGFTVRRPFPGVLSMAEADPFLVLDHLGPTVHGPEETTGAPWHPHRGFETVTYVLDGEVAHHDTHGSGGVIGEGDTQWMTAGASILHDELPTERVYRAGGPWHVVQLWVNLPASLKMTPARYQSITGGDLQLLTSDDGGALIRLIAGDIGGFFGPGSTYTPITYAHLTIEAGAQATLPWNPAFSAFAYALTGSATAGEEQRPVEAGQLVVYGHGDHLVVRASAKHGEPLNVMLFGGLPLREPIAHYGPFVMPTSVPVASARSPPNRAPPDASPDSTPTTHPTRKETAREHGAQSSRWG